jgi:hypothetical protein
MQLLFLATTCFALMLTGVHANGPVENGVTTSAHDSCLMITDENLLDYTTAHIDIGGGEEAWFTKLLNLNPRARGYWLGGNYVVSNPADVALVLPRGEPPKRVKLIDETERKLGRNTDSGVVRVFQVRAHGRDWQEAEDQLGNRYVITGVQGSGGVGNGIVDFADGRGGRYVSWWGLIDD